MNKDYFVNWKWKGDGIVRGFHDPLAYLFGELDTYGENEDE